jgi:alkylhydroperoxidase/carboxymuconolactone decarboxylase family protein YurZ
MKAPGVDAVAAVPLGGVTVAELRRQAEAALAVVAEGEPLDPQSAALIEFALRASINTLDGAGTRELATRALEAGAGAEQLQEVLSLVAGLGMHSWMEGSRHLAAALRQRDEGGLDPPLDPERSALWERCVGDDPYWQAFDAEVPGFLDSLLRLSPDAFEAFFSFCALPWKTATVPARTKELIALASDALPSHRFGPGFRLHLRGAIRTGAGRREIEEVLDLAAATPPHRGVA